MKAKNAIGALLENSGKSAVAVSREMGRADAYVSATLARGSVPRLDTFAEIAAACGYELVLRRAAADGQEITIEYE